MFLLQTRTVVTITVASASPLITLLALALSALPAVLTDAGSILTAAVLPTVDAAKSDTAVLAGPAGFTGTCVC